MTYKLFIDDERFPPNNDMSLWVISRSSDQTKQIIEGFGMPSFISFDHDLGGEDTSMVFLKWLEGQLIDRILAFPPGFAYYVHSQNPIGAKNITGKMDALIKHFSEKS